MIIDDTATLDSGPSADLPRSARAIFVRLGRNLVWLLGGRGVSGVLSLFYLGIAARALGAATFGAFALILGYAASIAGLAQFKSWQAVVRYGARHRAAARDDRLADLIGFTATIDAASALTGALLAIAGTMLVAPLFGWDPAQARLAGLFGTVILLTTGDSASGVLRLTDRFALLSLSATAAAAVRLIGAAAVWVAGGGLAAMLAAWIAAAIVECGLEWLFVLRRPEIRLALGRAAWRRACADNPGIRRFMVETSLATTLATLWQQAGLLGVGWFGGPAAAGDAEAAGKLATALAQPAEAATRALFPEFAALIANPEPLLLRRVVARTTAIGLALAAVLVALAATVGPLLLRLIAGPATAAALPFLLPLAVASAIDLVGIALEPLLAAFGSSRAILHARLLGAVALVAALALLMPLIGPGGAAAAMITGAIVLRLYEAVAARGVLSAAGGQDRAG